MSEDFNTIDYVVAPFWSDVNIRRGGGIHFQVYTSSNGSEKLNQVSRVIRNAYGDDTFHGTWMLVAQWRKVSRNKGTPTEVILLYFLKKLQVSGHG